MPTLPPSQAIARRQADHPARGRDPASAARPARRAVLPGCPPALRLPRRGLDHRGGHLRCRGGALRPHPHLLRRALDVPLHPGRAARAHPGHPARRCARRHVARRREQRGQPDGHHRQRARRQHGSFCQQHRIHPGALPAGISCPSPACRSTSWAATSPPPAPSPSPPCATPCAPWSSLRRASTPSSSASRTPAAPLAKCSPVKNLRQAPEKGIHPISYLEAVR